MQWITSIGSMHTLACGGRHMAVFGRLSGKAVVSAAAAPPAAAAAGGRLLLAAAAAAAGWLVEGAESVWAAW